MSLTDHTTDMPDNKDETDKTGTEGMTAEEMKKRDHKDSQEEAPDTM